MENGTDSSSNLSLEFKHFIVDSSPEGMRSCFDSESSVLFSNDNVNNSSLIKSIPFAEDNFCNRSKNSVMHCHDASQFFNGDETSSNEGNYSRQTFQEADSSQEFVNSQNSVDNLQDDISVMSINTDEQEAMNRPEFVDIHHFDFNGDSSVSSIGCHTEKVEANDAEIMYISYESENQMPDIMKLIQKDLSEPYSIYTYRYFIHNWPHLCFLNVLEEEQMNQNESYMSRYRVINFMYGQFFFVGIGRWEKIVWMGSSYSGGSLFPLFTWEVANENCSFCIWGSESKVKLTAVSKGKSVGAIVCKLDLHRKIIKRGYIAMLAVDESYRKKGIGSNLVLKAIRVMATDGADEVVLETEITNQPALRLYENLGFVRDKRLFRYYLNGVDALRLKLWLR